MQQRLGLGVALSVIQNSSILDEPTSALDPLGRHDVREIIRDLQVTGPTVFLNTHLLEEAEHVCDRSRDRSGSFDRDRRPGGPSRGNIDRATEGLRPSLTMASRCPDFGALVLRRRVGAVARHRARDPGPRFGDRDARRSCRGGHPRTPKPRRPLPRVADRSERPFVIAGLRSARRFDAGSSRRAPRSRLGSSDAARWVLIAWATRKNHLRRSERWRYLKH